MSERAGASASAGRDLPLAIGVGLLLAALFLGSLFWHPLAFTFVVFGLATVGILEVARILSRLERPVYVAVLLGALAATLGGTYAQGAQGQVAGVVMLFAGAALWTLARPRRPDVVGLFARTCFVGLWVPLLASFAVLLVTRGTDGPAAVLAVAGGAILGDIGGYAFGSIFGRNLIAPAVSPKKTWEGLVGGLVLTAVVAWLVLPLLGELFADPLDGVLVAVAAAVAGFFGDLVESMVKRDIGVKDLGDILPGHGGILDRVDGILLALPVGYWVLALLT